MSVYNLKPKSAIPATSGAGDAVDLILFNKDNQTIVNAYLSGLNNIMSDALLTESASQETKKYFLDLDSKILASLSGDEIKKATTLPVKKPGTAGKEQPKEVSGGSRSGGDGSKYNALRSATAASMPNYVPPGSPNAITVTLGDPVHSGTQRRAGQLVLRDKDGKVLGVYQADSGGRKDYPAPAGTYNITPGDGILKSGMTVPDGNNGAYGYKYNMNDVYDPRAGRMRKGLRIHPDGGPPGTQGCIGVIGGVDTQKDFQKKFDQVLQENGGKYTMVVDY